MSVGWDAERYERQPLPHERWGERVIDRAGLRAGESLVDAGCGTGRDAERALGRLRALSDESGTPPGRVTLLDADAAMVAAARRRFAGYTDGSAPDVKQADLLEPWPVDAPADVIISVAALHWIGDHEMVFRRAGAIGTHHARLHVDCGGAGNIASIVQAAGRVGMAVPVWNFATVDDTVRALRAGGWDPQDVWLQADPLILPDDPTFREFMASVMFHSATAEQVDAVVALCEQPTVDYVRLNIDARRT